MSRKKNHDRRRLQQKVHKALSRQKEQLENQQAQVSNPRQPPQQPDAALPPGGQGARLESGLTPSQENQLITQAVANRWGITGEIKQEALATTRRNIGDQDGRVSNTAVGNLIRMEAQNQEDEKRAAGGDNLNVHLSGGIGVVQRSEDDINARILDYLSEYAALEAKAVVIEMEPQPRMVGQNGRNGTHE